MRALDREVAGWRGRRLWLLGVGNVGQGDDGFGVRLAEALAPRLGGPARAVDAGTAPERFVGRAAADGCEALVFADAARFGAAPGSLLLADTAELLARPPAASTHRVPIAVLAKYAEGLGMRAWLLGVQPATLEGPALSPPVAGTLDVLTDLLAAGLGPVPAARPEPEEAGSACRRGEGEARAIFEGRGAPAPSRSWFDRLTTSGPPGAER